MSKPAGRKALLATMVVATGGAAALLVFLPRHTAPAGYQIDIARLPGLKDSLSATFTVEMQPTQTVTQENVDKLTAALKTLTVTPPECLNTAAANFGQTVGTVVTSLSAHNQQFGVVIKAAESPRPFVTPPTIDACRTFDVERPTAPCPAPMSSTRRRSSVRRRVRATPFRPVGWPGTVWSISTNTSPCSMTGTW